MTTLDHPEYEKIGREVVAYCKKYKIRIEDFFSILNDQKVIPMLRGKASEYDAAFALLNMLDPQVWIVNKLNLNPQPGTNDQDIGVTHRRTGIQIIVETKNAVRGSMSTGARTRKLKVPHFKVKCHKSRSNKKTVYNDRYLASEFEIVVATTTNALFKKGTVGEEFEIVSEPGLLQMLEEYYGVSDFPSLIDAANKDWRFARSSTLTEEYKGYLVIPRTPSVLLSNDPNWLPLNQIQAHLDAIVREKVQARN